MVDLATYTFEDGTVQGWTSATAAVANSNAQAHSGTRSLVVQPIAGGTHGAVSPHIPVVPGRQYTVEVWVRKTAAAQVLQTFLSFYEADGVTIAGTPNGLGQSASIGYGILNTWEKNVISGVAPPTAVTMRVAPFAYSMVSGGTLYIDDVVFKTETGSLLLGRPLVKHGGGNHRMIDNDLLPWSHNIDAAAFPDGINPAAVSWGAVNKTWWFGLLGWNTGLNSWWAFDVYLAKGMWRMEWFRDKRNDYPIVQYSVDTINQGNTFDLYAAARTRTVHAVGGMHLERGWHRFQSTAVSKNAAASSSYTHVFSGLVLTREA